MGAVNTVEGATAGVACASVSVCLFMCFLVCFLMCRHVSFNVSLYLCVSLCMLFPYAQLQSCYAMKTCSPTHVVSLSFTFGVYACIILDGPLL